MMFGDQRCKCPNCGGVALYVETTTYDFQNTTLRSMWSVQTVRPVGTTKNRLNTTLTMFL